ncbi:MAG: precorrin-6A reductase [Lachnospiraceae bacterium]|nr:precorrin-6A reductase [Lachnospiraceae bacterium]
MDKGVLIFGGTSEGRTIAWKLSALNIPCTVCVASEYGEYAMGSQGGSLDNSPEIHVGRMNEEEMRQFITTGKYTLVVDATHPHAAEVSENIRKALENTDTGLIRLTRNVGGSFDEAEKYDRIRYFDSFENCVEALKYTKGNILLTTGAKELSGIGEEQVLSRTYARILPSAESVEKATEAGIPRSHIIAVQGPFSERMNEVMMAEYNIKTVVTKASGDAGGYREKLLAARECKTDVFVIRPPMEGKAAGNVRSVELDNVWECIRYICRRYKTATENVSVEISLIGMGMGDESLMSQDALEALHSQDVYFGSPRLLELLPEKTVKYPVYEPEEVLSTLRKLILDYPFTAIKAAVLYSGDTGFFSGAKRMSASIKAFSDNSGIDAELKLYPGVSSISYFSARTGISYDNAVIISHHGRRANVLSEVMMNRKVFLLVSDAAELKILAQKINDSGLKDITIHAGYDLSSQSERVICVRASDYSFMPENGICCAFILNDGELLPITPSLGDGFFRRGAAPMTKEEIRQLSICKLKLPKDAVLYDIGSGTGSVSVESARLSNDMRVYAIEREEEAASLTAANVSRAGLENVTVINASAPEAFEGLEAPTHVFIGGSGGRLEDIVRAIMTKKQGKVRIVVNVVTLETMSVITELLFRLKHEDEEIIGVQVNYSETMGRYHMMKSGNMIYIVSFELR